MTLHDTRHLIVLACTLAAWPLATVERAGAGEPPVAAQDAATRDRDLYVGRWAVVAIESGGETRPEFGHEVIVINRPDGTWTMSVDGRELNRGESRMDPLADPPEVDIEITAGEGKGKVLQGIYEVTRTRRRLCFRDEQGWRPREFRTQPGDGAVLVTFERRPDEAAPRER